MESAYLVYYRRTPFSRSRPKEPERDAFNGIRMDYALSLLIRDAVESLSLDPKDISDVLTGCAYQRDENWTFGGRHPVMLAHLPPSVPSAAIDRACSSSMNAIAFGAMEIMTGNADLVLAGGFEHMTHVPRLSNRLCEQLLDDPSYSSYDMKTGYYMGLTAEKLARQEGIHREEMDTFSLRSHRLAARAVEEGYLREEILPVEVPSGNGKTKVEQDQSIRFDASLEKMSSLPPVFAQDGVITAGNSSPLNAGASLVVLASGAMLRKYRLNPLSKILSMAWAGVDPSIMGEAVVPASQKALEKIGMHPGKVDLWEINEAFAVVPLNAERKLNIDRERVNVKGGAIAIGHPLGATGARIAGTLSRMLHMGMGETGVATLCVGGGQGYAMVLQK